MLILVAGIFLSEYNFVQKCRNCMKICMELFARYTYTVLYSANSSNRVIRERVPFLCQLALVLWAWVRGGGGGR
jgi:hypothetical protein